MKVAVIGSGGREFAICKKIHIQNPEVKLFCIPGNDGMDFLERVSHIGVLDFEKIVDFCKNKEIDFCIVTPDDPLVLGLVDILEREGIKAFGPSKNAAKLEGSKSFAKSFMGKYGIPTASYKAFSDLHDALNYIEKSKFPIVIKADGLALGKGVVIAENLDQAKATLIEFMVEGKFGDSSKSLVIEEFLQGPEISVLSFCDTKTVVPMLSSMDHKRVFDGDLGPNTGGMGVIAPNPVFTNEVEKEFVEKIMLPTLKGLQKEGLDFRGCLYFGLMLTEDGLRVIEYNARFGDPETQAILPLLESNLLDIMLAVSDGRLDSKFIRFSDKASACLVMACEGYPENPVKLNRINYSEDIKESIYFAGVKFDDEGKLISSAGRVLNVIGLGSSLREAVDDVYDKVELIHFNHSHYRKDIGLRALELEGKNAL